MSPELTFRSSFHHLKKLDVVSLVIYYLTMDLLPHRFYECTIKVGHVHELSNETSLHSYDNKLKPSFLSP